MKQHGLLLRFSVPCSLKPKNIDYKKGIAAVEKTKEDTKICKHLKISDDHDAFSDPTVNSWF